MTRSREHTAGKRSRVTWDWAQSVLAMPPGEDPMQTVLEFAFARLSEVPHSDLRIAPLYTMALWMGHLDA